MSSTRQRLGIAAIILASIFFAAMAVLTRPLAGQVPSGQVALVRFLIGIVGAAAMLLARRQWPASGRWDLLALRGLLGGGAALTYFLALERLGAGPATVLNYASPIFAAAFAFVFLKEAVAGLARLGMIVAAVGAAVVASSTHELVPSALPGLGVASGVLSAVLGGAAMVAVRRLRSDTSALTVFLAFCVVGALMSAPWTVTRWIPLEGAALGYAVAVGVTGLVAQLLYTWAMKYVTTAQGTGLMQLVPPLSWLLAVAFLGEHPTVPGLVGTALCVGGVTMGTLGHRPAITRNAAGQVPQALRVDRSGQ